MTKDTAAFIESLFEFYQQSSSGKEPENAEALRLAWDELEKMKGNIGFFTVSQVHRDDLRGQGFDADNVSDEAMQRIADRMGEGFTESGAYWDALDAACKDVPRIKK